jgi:hypothetical protein
MLKKVKAQEMYQISNVVKRLSNLPLPVKIAYGLSKNLKTIDREVEILNVSRQKLIDEFAERDENGKIVMLSEIEIKLKEETRDEFNDKFKEFLEMDVEFDVFTISINQFTAADIKLTPAEMTVLDFIFDMEEIKN